MGVYKNIGCQVNEIPFRCHEDILWSKRVCAGDHAESGVIYTWKDEFVNDMISYASSASSSIMHERIREWVRVWIRDGWKYCYPQEPLSSPVVHMVRAQHADKKLYGCDGCVFHDDTTWICPLMMDCGDNIYKKV